MVLLFCWQLFYQFHTISKKYKGFYINFSTLNISKEFVLNIDSLGYKQMTDIQAASLPHILENKDIIAQAKTGSGKTVSFGIGLVNKLNVKKFRIQSVILCPTRELANQVAEEIRKLARFIHNVKILTLCGGVAYKPQVASLFHGAHIIVGTPGRVLKHLKEQNLSFDDVNTLVLDEADRMLDMGFTEDINEIIDFMPKTRQTLLFSATFQDNIKEMSSNILNEPIIVSTKHKEEAVKIEQAFYQIETESKSSLLPSIFSTYKPKSVVIFCNTKIACDNLSDDFYDLGFDVVVLHSDLEQKDRDETLILFSNKSYPILIATDVASRGLDIDDIDLIINFDIAHEPAIHTHRIGRSARAGKSGISIGLVNSDDLDKFEDIKLQSKEKFELLHCSTLIYDADYKLDSDYRAMYINGGKKDKVRAGDILGCLIQDIGLQKDDIGKINTLLFHSYVAIKKEVFEKAFDAMQNKKIKGKYFRTFKR